MKLALAMCLLASTALADDGLNRQQLKAGMDKVKEEVAGCGRAYSKVKGTVKVRIEVAPDGHVEKAKFYVSPDRALGACIVAVIKNKATFDASKAGAHFDYPYVF